MPAHTHSARARAHTFSSSASQAHEQGRSHARPGTGRCAHLRRQRPGHGPLLFLHVPDHARDPIRAANPNARTLESACLVCARLRAHARSRFACNPLPPPLPPIPAGRPACRPLFSLEPEKAPALARMRLSSDSGRCPGLVQPHPGRCSASGATHVTLSLSHGHTPARAYTNKTTSASAEWRRW